MSKKDNKWLLGAALGGTALLLILTKRPKASKSSPRSDMGQRPLPDPGFPNRVRERSYEEIHPDDENARITLRRVLWSEDSSGGPTVWRYIADAVINKTIRSGKDLKSRIAPSGFGKQGGDRPFSTARTPPPAREDEIDAVVEEALESKTDTAKGADYIWEPHFFDSQRNQMLRQRRIDDGDAHLSSLATWEGWGPKHHTP